MGLKNKIKIISIEDINIDEYINISYFDQFSYGKLLNFIKKFGQIQLLTVIKENDVYKLIDGFYVYKALLELKKKEVIIFDLGKMEEKDQITYKIGMKSSFKQDMVALSYLFKRLNEIDPEFSYEGFIPYYKEEIRRYPELIEFDFKKYDSNLHNDIYLKSDDSYF
jgi:hypothetical protein